MQRSMASKPSFFSTHSDIRLKRVTCETLNSVDWYSRRAYNGAESYRYYSSDEEVDQWQGAPPTEEEREEEEEGQATYDSDSESGQGHGQGQGQGQCHGHGHGQGHGHANYHSSCRNSYCHTYYQWRGQGHGQGHGQGQGRYRGQGYGHVHHLVRAKIREEDKREMSTRPWLHDDNGIDSAMALPWHHHIGKRMSIMSSRGQRLETSCGRKEMPARPITSLTHFAPIITHISGYSSSPSGYVAKSTNVMTSSPRRHRYDATIFRDRVKHGRSMPASSYDEPCSPQVTCFGKVKIKDRYRKKLGKISCVTRGQLLTLP